MIAEEFGKIIAAGGFGTLIDNATLTTTGWVVSVEVIGDGIYNQAGVSHILVRDESHIPKSQAIRVDEYYTRLLFYANDINDAKIKGEEVLKYFDNRTEMETADNRTIMVCQISENLLIENVYQAENNLKEVAGATVKLTVSNQVASTGRT